MDHILLITNANAGTNEQDAVQQAVAVLMNDTEVEVVATESEQDLDEVLAGLAGRIVVAAGGDGTLHAVVNALAKHDLLGATRLGIIPLGTGNDFARGVGLPLGPAEAAEVIRAGNCVPADLVVDDEGLVVVNNVHLGVGAQASRKAEKWKPRFGKVGLGVLGYATGALTAGLKPRFLKIEVTVDGVRLEGKELTEGHRVAQVAIGNGSSVGGGTELIPGADPGSGHLVVIVSRAVGRLRRLAYMARLRGGSHHLMKEVTRVNGSEISVKGEEFYCVADGEISGPYTAKSWTLRRGAIQLFRTAH